NDSAPTLAITSGSLSCDFPTLGTAGMPFAACTIAFSADNLSLWTNKQPNLYALEVNLSGSGVPGVLDRFITQVGFRNFTIVDSKFELNGAPVYLAGTSIHEEWENSGRTLTTAQIFTDLSLMKNLSCNIFRSHYPMNPVYYLYADRLGLSAWQECPDYWFNEVNFIEADISNSTWAMFLEMVYRDFDRPSIFFQGVTNEPISEKLLVSYLQERKALLAFVDPSRILGFAGASNYLVNPGWAVTDIVGFNCYWGLEEGVLGDYYNQARSAMATVAKANPGKPILVTEFSPGNDTGNTMVQPFEDYVKAFEENPAICGILYWVFADYVGYSGSTQSTGVYSFDRTQERPTGPVMQALYTNLTAANP
ncbi:MAG TPA: glycoside hydrolase family 2 TIM barrel-domain containing protein, partial [Candidatus Lokiarchaeia archaeon]|nr:glycoside hydrolase family 2 TIM barrel-domain containing protein [Candidatus Lokiarchaeia archaeon]